MNTKPLVSGIGFLPMFMAMAVLMTACASMGSGPNPTPGLAPTAPVSQAVQEHESVAAARRDYREYLAWIEDELVHRVEAEVEEMLGLGWVRSLDDMDLWHLHIGYPRGFFPEDLTQLSLSKLYSIHQTAPYHLLYHSMERPHEVRRRWMNALAQAEHKELRRWVAQIEEHEFDYRDFFFSSGRYTRPPALEPDTLARYAELWAAEDSPERPPEVQRLREYRNRLTFIVGSAQPGYFRAARELLQSSSIVSRVVETEAGYKHELKPVSHRYPPGYHYPVMVVFGPSAEGAPFFGVSHVIRGEELVFGVRALVYADINPR